MALVLRLQTEKIRLPVEHIVVTRTLEICSVIHGMVTSTRARERENVAIALFNPDRAISEHVLPSFKKVLVFVLSRLVM